MMREILGNQSLKGAARISTAVVPGSITVGTRSDSIPAPRVPAALVEVLAPPALKPSYANLLIASLARAAASMLILVIDINIVAKIPI
jgi:hypothetical protein